MLRLVLLLQVLLRQVLLWWVHLRRVLLRRIFVLRRNLVRQILKDRWPDHGGWFGGGSEHALWFLHGQVVGEVVHNEDHAHERQGSR